MLESFIRLILGFGGKEFEGVWVGNTNFKSFSSEEFENSSTVLSEPLLVWDSSAHQIKSWLFKWKAAGFSCSLFGLVLNQNLTVFKGQISILLSSLTKFWQFSLVRRLPEISSSSI
jgi:hypothetical protein